MDLIADASGARQFLVFLDHIGLDERRLGVGKIDPALRASSAPLAVPARLTIELMEAAAEAKKWPDLGVRFAEWLSPNALSPLSLLGIHCATYADRCRLSRRYVHLYNTALSYEQVNENENVVILCQVQPTLLPRARQFVEWNVAHSVKNARSMLGDRWSPVRVEFAHASPASIAAHQRHFRCPIRYESDRTGFVIKRTDFYRRLPMENRQTVEFLEDYLAREELHQPSDLRSKVESLVTAHLAGGNASLERIAALLTTSSRTLQRRLSEHGADFREILNFVRVQIAKDLLSQKPPPSLQRLSQLLGYSDPSAAGRFIKSQLGASPRAILNKGGTTRRRLDAFQ